MRDLSVAVDVLGVATAALRARPGRAALMAAGPFLGVAVIVGTFGTLQSTSGELRDALERLGHSLVIVEAAGSGGDSRLPGEARSRVESVPTVTGVVDLADVSVTATAARPALDRSPIAIDVLTGGATLAEVLGVGIASGRPLSTLDEDHATAAAVVGSEVARRIHLDVGSMQSVYVGEYAFGVVGILEPALLRPQLDHSVLIPASTAERLFGTSRSPSQLLVRAADGTVRDTAVLLPSVITYGGPGAPSVAVASDLLAARVEVDRALGVAVWGIGILAMLVGGLGIVNVMLIAVVERRREIGVRRALGHLRSVVALQFVGEAGLIGALGAITGGAVAIVFVLAIAGIRGWIPVLDTGIVVGAIAAAWITTIIAALYPAMRAARLQPLEALRED